MGLVKLFFISKQDWIKTSKRGKKRYIIVNTIKLGFFYLIFYLLVTHLQNANYVLSEIDIKKIIIDFLFYLPFSIILGFVASIYFWNYYQDKFKEDLN